MIQLWIEHNELAFNIQLLLDLDQLVGAWKACE